MRKILLTIITILSFSLSASANNILKMATIEPSLGQAIFMATFANVVSNNLDDVEIEVSGGGAATLHMMEVGRGNLDFSMTSPVVYNLMAGGQRMYAKQHLSQKLRKNYRKMLRLQMAFL